jgi:flagellin-like protein
MQIGINRKGITPVIAIVLLLMVTVGAVGVVYTQFQSLVGDPTEQIDSQQRNQNTDMNIVRGKASNESNPRAANSSLILELQNTGSVTRNTTSFRVTTDDSSLVPGQGGQLDIQADNSSNLSSRADNSTLLDPDETMDFYTGIPFPGPTDGVLVTLNLKGSDKEYTLDCRPQTSSTTFCR